MKDTNARLILVNAADSAGLSASPDAAPGLPVSNLQVQERSYTFRATSAAPQVITGNLPASRNVDSDGVALTGDFSAYATCRIRLYAETALGGAVVYDSGVTDVSPRGKTWFRFFSGVGIYWSFRIDFTDASPPAGYHEFSRLVMGRGMSTSINIDVGYEYAIDDDTAQERDAGGGIHSDPGAVYYSLKFQFSHVREDERAALHDALRWVGKTRDFFIALRPYHTYRFDFAALVKFTAMPRLSQRYFNHYAIPFEVSETSGGYAGTVVPAPSTGGGVTALDAAWTLAVNGNTAITEFQAIDSDEAGTAIVAYQGNTLLRSVDHGLTWLPVTITACTGRITDVWHDVSNGFLVCDDHGAIYRSADGSTPWATVKAADGFRLDRVVGFPDTLIIAVGERVIGGTAVGGFVDFSADSGWDLLPYPAGAAIMRTSQYSADLFPAWAGNVYANYVSPLSFTPSSVAGIPVGESFTAAFLFGPGIIFSTTGNRLYSMQGDPASAVEIYTPPAGYLIHDVITVLGNTVVGVSMAGPGGDRKVVWSMTGTAGDFHEITVAARANSTTFSRVAWTGKRIVLTDSGRVWVSPVL